jgi:hypothetical protein
MTKVFEEQPLALPGSANKISKKSNAGRFYGVIQGHLSYGIDF